MAIYKKQVKRKDFSDGQAPMSNEVDKSIRRLLKTKNDVKEYEDLVRETKKELLSIEDEVKSLLIKENLTDCLSINWARLRKYN